MTTELAVHQGDKTDSIQFVAIEIKATSFSSLAASPHQIFRSRKIKSNLADHAAEKTASDWIGLCTEVLRTGETLQLISVYRIPP